MVPEMVAVVVAICAWMGGVVPVERVNRNEIAPQNERNRDIQLFLVINVQPPHAFGVACGTFQVSSRQRSRPNPENPATFLGVL